MLNGPDNRFQAIVNASSDGIIVVDHSGIVQFINPAASALFGRTDAELLGSMFGFPVVEGEITELDILRRGGEISVAEMRVVELEWGDDTAYLALLRDITQRKQTQNELQSLYNAVSYLLKSDSLESLSQQVAAAVVREFNHVDCGLLLVNPDRIVISRVARAGENKVDTDEELFIDGPGLVPEAIRSGKPVYVPNVLLDMRYVENHPLTRSELVVPLRTANGTLGVLDLQSTRIDGFTEAQQRILVAFADRAALAIENRMFYEELNQRAMELEWRVAARTADLVRAKERVEAILNNASDPIVLAHSDGSIQQTNPAFFETYGWKTVDIMGTPIFHLFEDERSQLEEAFYITSTKGVPTRVEVTGRHHDGKLFVNEIALAPIIQAEANIMSVICILRDISERRQLEEGLRQSLEQERELSLLKSRIVSMASHEFRTPLAVVMTSAYSLKTYRSRMDEDHIDRSLNKITQQVKHLTEIMDDVLDLGRLQSDRTDFNPIEFDLDELCCEIQQEFQSISETSHEIIYNNAHKPTIVQLDKHLMRRIITNLVSNAIKYSRPETQVFINIDQTDTAVTLKIVDQGIGIPEKDLHRLFEPFHRAGNVGVVSGTGLGLSITKQAVEIHGGHISVESVLDMGTTFTVHLPLVSKRELAYQGNSVD